MWYAIKEILALLFGREPAPFVFPETDTIERSMKYGQFI